MILGKGKENLEQNKTKWNEQNNANVFSQITII